jgi:hypothetical protein
MRYESVVLENLQKNHQMLRRLAYLQQLKLSVVGRQREEMGLSMLFLAVLLNIHETTLMNIECGIALPTDNTGVRMNMLGIEVRLTESSPVLPLTRIEIQVYKKIKSMSQDERILLSGNVSNYIAVKRMQEGGFDRNYLMDYVLGPNRWC